MSVVWLKMGWKAHPIIIASVTLRLYEPSKLLLIHTLHGLQSSDIRTHPVVDGGTHIVFAEPPLQQS